MKNLKTLVKNWDKIKKLQAPLRPVTYGPTNFASVIGMVHWDNPELIWVLTTDNEEDYEGSQTQIGVSREGKLYWEYQSHCSCNGYEDSKGCEHEFPPSDITKHYELTEICKEWELHIEINIKKLLDLLK